MSTIEPEIIEERDLVDSAYGFGLNPVLLFPNEFRLIENESVRYTLFSLFAAVPKHFAEMPSSSSGKYHPADEFSKGGNVLHTRRVVRVLQHLCDMKGWAGLEKDVLVAAALIHDTGQYGWHDQPEAKTVERHELVPYDGTITMCNLPFYYNILGVAALHSGRWGPRLEDLPPVLWSGARSMNLGPTMHTADLLASRREILVDVDRGFDE